MHNYSPLNYRGHRGDSSLPPRVKASWYGRAFLFVVAFVFANIGTNHLAKHYTIGDPEHYSNFYDSLVGAPLSAVSALQYTATGSSEPVYGILMWISANAGIAKVSLTILANSLLIYGLLEYLRVNQTSKFVYLLCLSNYYLFVLLYPADRLKYSYVALLFIVVSGKSVMKWAWALIAPLLHFQSLINYITAISLSSTTATAARWAKQSQGRKAIMALSLIVPIAVALVYYPYVVGKFQSYGRMRSLSAAFQCAMLFMVGALVINDMAKLLRLMVPPFMFVLLLGPERVNMVAFVMFSHVVFGMRRQAHPAYVLLLLYLSGKSLNFFASVYRHGHGFSADAFLF